MRWGCGVAAAEGCDSVTVFGSRGGRRIGRRGGHNFQGKKERIGPTKEGVAIHGVRRPVERAKLSFFKEGWRGNELGGVAGEILDLEMDRRFGRRTGVCVKPLQSSGQPQQWKHSLHRFVGGTIQRTMSS